MNELSPLKKPHIKLFKDIQRILLHLEDLAKFGP